MFYFPGCVRSLKKYMAPKTRRVYTFVREQLDVEMHGEANFQGFVSDDGTPNYGKRSIGESVGIIYQAIRSGRVEKVLAGLFHDA